MITVADTAGTAARQTPLDEVTLPLVVERLAPITLALPYWLPYVMCLTLVFSTDGSLDWFSDLGTAGRLVDALLSGALCAVTLWLTVVVGLCLVQDINNGFNRNRTVQLDRNGIWDSSVTRSPVPWMGVEMIGISRVEDLGISILVRLKVPSTDLSSPPYRAMKQFGISQRTFVIPTWQEDRQFADNVHAVAEAHGVPVKEPYWIPRFDSVLPWKAI